MVVAMMAMAIVVIMAMMVMQLNVRYE